MRAKRKYDRFARPLPKDTVETPSLAEVLVQALQQQVAHEQHLKNRIDTLNTTVTSLSERVIVLENLVTFGRLREEAR